MDFFDAAIREVSVQIEQINDPSFREVIEMLSTTNGIQRRIAETVSAEIGTNMGQFRSGSSGGVRD